MNGAETVLATVTTFVVTHFLLSHPLRRPLVAALGEKGFLGVYSLVAVATLGATVWAYRMAEVTPLLWEVGGGLWAISTILMLLASVLLMGSLMRNPALVGAQSSAATASARGVYAVTRHPMMWAFAVWGVAHILIYPVTKNIILSGAIIVLSLVGAAFQDHKKATLDPQGWSAWIERTSYLPFAAIIAGRAKLGGFGTHALAGGLILWLAATWAHIPLAGWPAGIWRWIV
ncbi:MAG: MFS transporter [Sphingomonas sp.]|nr:MAG: MFS transporter [Sphingomonas sp.]